MSKKTVSEELFERFCELHKIKCEPIEEKEGVRTPDYFISLKRQDIVVEVKEIGFEIKENESDSQDNSKNGSMYSHGWKHGEYVRKAIDRAKTQIKNVAKGKYPSILVLYNNSTYNFPVLEGQEILVGMYGYLTLDITIPTRDSPPKFVGKRLGPSRRMTKEHNTSISAVGVLEKDERGNPFIKIYHNKYAAIPLNAELFSALPVKQFELYESVPNEFPNWRDI